MCGCVDVMTPTCCLTSAHIVLTHLTSRHVTQVDTSKPRATGLVEGTTHCTTTTLHTPVSRAMPLSLLLAASTPRHISRIARTCRELYTHCHIDSCAASTRTTTITSAARSTKPMSDTANSSAVKPACDNAARPVPCAGLAEGPHIQ